MWSGWSMWLGRPSGAGMRSLAMAATLTGSNEWSTWYISLQKLVHAFIWWMPAHALRGTKPRQAVSRGL